MATYTKEIFSSSTNGRPIKIGTTPTPIHTTPTTGKDEVWLYAYNSSATPTLLTVQFGGSTQPDDQISQTVSSQTGLSFVLPGLVLAPTGTALNISAYATVANVVTISGYVNRIT